MFTIRFDMRAPSSGAPTDELYAAAIDMCAWAETRGAIVAVLSEHHGAEDNHLPSPIVLASAIAARTERLPIMLAAVVLPFWDPVRLAEDMSVLDIISNGRVSYAFGIGHRPQEYEHFGVDMNRRGRLADEKLTLLRQLLTGRPVVSDGRRIHVTPACTSTGGPFMMLADDAPTAVFVADDVDKAWDELGPHLLHDAVTAAAYRHGVEGVASISRATDVNGLREAGGPYRVFTTDEAVDYMRGGQALPLAPLCGGVPPDVAWPYLERAAEAAARIG